MAKYNDLMYPPGFKPSANTAASADATVASTEKKAYHFEPPTQVATDRVVLITNPDNHKYSLTEAKLRIYSCCRDLGVSQTAEVKYPDLQKAYKMKFDIELGRDELFNLFLNRNATNSLREGLRSFMDVIEAAKTEDNTIRLKLKENAEEYIQELENRYEGPPFRHLTPEQVESIRNPQKYYYQNMRNDNFGPQRYQQSRGYWAGPRFMGRGNQNDNGHFPFYPQRQQYFNQFDGPQGGFFEHRPGYNRWGGPGDNYYRDGQYSQNPNFQRPFNPYYQNNYGPNNYANGPTSFGNAPNNYSNPPNNLANGPMAALVNEKKQKIAERQKLKEQSKTLRENYAKLTQDHFDELERIKIQIREECESNMEALFESYYQKLGEFEKYAVEENKHFIEAFQKLQK